MFDTTSYKKNMNRILLLACFALALTGCKKANKLTQFNMSYDETAVIPASSGINLPFNILAPDVESNSEATFEANDTRKDLIEIIKLTKLSITITSPPNEDFSFLKSISVFISASGVPETRIAWVDNVPSNSGSELNLSVSDTDLKEFIKGDRFSLRVNSVTDEVLTSDYHLNIHSTFFVDAKLIK